MRLLLRSRVMPADAPAASFFGSPAISYRRPVALRTGLAAGVPVRKVGFWYVLSYHEIDRR
jgi:hypothetical protein